jgi:predicted nucleic acid-binding protein
MKCIFDSSTIFEAIKENAVEVLAGNSTLDLTGYELGNILWKEHTIHKRINREELKKLVKITKEVLNLMEILTINCHEEEILSIAESLKITFYDASYIYHAKNKKIPLATEDTELANKAKSQINTLKLNNLI